LVSRNGHGLNEASARSLLDCDTSHRSPEIERRDVLAFASPGDAFGSFLAEVFRSLIGWRRLPHYRFEERVDGFLLHFLPGLFEKHLGWEAVKVVAPEWPVGPIGVRADALLHRGGPSPAWVLLEIKTDIETARKDRPQWRHRVRTARVHKTMKSLAQHLRQVVDDSKSKPKAEQRYQLYLDALQSSRFSLDDPVEAALLSPGETGTFEMPGATVVSYDDLLKLRWPEAGAAWELFRDAVVHALVLEPSGKRAGTDMVRLAR
jgi:hypothetical protein